MELCSDKPKPNRLSNQKKNNAVSGTKNEANASNVSSAFGFLNSECDNLFGINFFSLSSKIKAFMPNYLKASNNQEKQIMLLSILFEIHSQCP